MAHRQPISQINFTGRCQSMARGLGWCNVCNHVCACRVMMFVCGGFSSVITYFA
jgi:hypothetical protein